MLPFSFVVFLSSFSYCPDVKDPNGIKLFVEAFWAILGTLVIFYVLFSYIVQYFFLTL